MILYILSFINTLTNLFDTIYVSAQKAINAVIDSQKPDIYVFLQRNAIPWISKKNMNGYFSFYNNIFYESEYTELKRGLDDVVTAELRDSNGVVIDATEFFHSLRWPEDSPPSLYEMILVLLLTNGILIKEEVLLTYSLHVMTIEEPDLVIPLNDKSKEPFKGF